jgi:hypothetical protein
MTPCIYCNAENCVHNEGNGECSARETMVITNDGHCIDYAPNEVT